MSSSCFEKVQREGFEPSKGKPSRFTVCPRWPLGYLWYLNTLTFYQKMFTICGENIKNMSVYLNQYD